MVAVHQITEENGRTCVITKGATIYDIKQRPTNNVKGVAGDR